MLNRVLPIEKMISFIFYVSFIFLSCKKKDPFVPLVTALSCNTSSFSVTYAIMNQPYNAIATVPYNSGNGFSYDAGSEINSSGVSGLKAKLISGTLAVGSGNISLSITGTPTSQGTAQFAIQFGGQSCTLSLPVQSGGGTQLPAVYQHIYGATSITYDGTWVTIKTNDTPNHNSVYYPLGHPRHEAFSGLTFNNMNFVRNPNNIITQNITIKIPANPTVASVHQSTPLGVIGVAIDGVPFFNQYAGPNQPLTGEMASFDQYWAHPQQTGMYHYHVEPKYLTTIYATKHSLMGFLLDGFPVYGPEEESGFTPTGLDVYHGHTHATVDYPMGIYHYHFSQTSPYLNGNGFYGNPGTITQ